MKIFPLDAPCQPDWPLLLERARHGLDAFRAIVADVPYEHKGILYSEMFFFLTCAGAVAPRRILESGRARGQSTLILSRCFPETPIISIEYDRNSPDVAVAADRLKTSANVDLRFGDACEVLPAIAEDGDVAIIDGPKGHRGLRLALRLLTTRKVQLVFVHDTSPGTAERSFLERRMPRQVRYSDDPLFAEIAHVLDGNAETDIPPERRYAAVRGRYGYGFSLACIPFRPEAHYGGLLLAAVWDGFANRVLRRAP